MVNVCFLLHFYQPSNQLESITKRITQECYVPLIKLIKSDKRLNLTANFPLALLAQLDAYGYHSLLADIKELVNSQRVEIVGSGAYHPLFTKIPKHLAEEQILLNEVAQSYYFGMSKDFEGEPCYMIKDLKGFFSPEMAINLDLVGLVGSLGYEWIIADEFCLTNSVISSHISGKSYRFGKQQIRLLVRDRELSNELAFKRDQNIEEFINKISQKFDNVVIALDAETFGHHYADGIYLFDSILSAIHKKGLQTATISQAYEKEDAKVIDTVKESTWSTVEISKPYPLWESDYEVNKALWGLFNELHNDLAIKYGENTPDLVGKPDTAPVWLGNFGKGSKGMLTLLKLEQSDQFWWSSYAKVGNKVIYNTYMASSVLSYYREVVRSLGLNPMLNDKIEKVSDLINVQSY